VSEGTTPYEFRAPLTVCVDFRNPHAYLAVAPTRTLERRLGFAVDWLPLSAPPLHRPPPARPEDDRGTRHRRIRALYFERDLARYAASRGLELGEVHRTADTAFAAMGLLWLRRIAPARAGEFVASVFDLLWREEADVGAPDVIRRTVESVAGAAGGFDGYVAQEGRSELEALARALAVAGVSGVPAYVLAGGELFLGRQHLPLLEWRLTRSR
jgi:2-hydroxychromene-2-carboxylate isomerase